MSDHQDYMMAQRQFRDMRQQAKLREMSATAVIERAERAGRDVHVTRSTRRWGSTIPAGLPGNPVLRLGSGV